MRCTLDERPEAAARHGAYGKRNTSPFAAAATDRLDILDDSSLDGRTPSHPERADGEREVAREHLWHPATLGRAATADVCPAPLTREKRFIGMGVMYYGGHRLTFYYQS